MIELGTILQNRYRIEKHIGQGGMGKVYVASDQRFNSTVAIKETVFEDKNLRKAFEREARLLNSLKHQALPRVSDHFTEGDGQFLVMEFVAGEDLAEMMERDGKAFPLEKVLNWADQLCNALEYLHEQDIIHRDIKPQNLKITPGGQIVLLDFGLAKGNPTDAPHHTAAKSIFGYSRSYASLEQIQGTGTEPRSDLYSLGATVYHLLTGIPPADALTRAMNVLNGKSDPLIPANLVNNQVPRGVAEILQRSMALNASERPVSAVEMQQMLKESDKAIDFTENNSAFASSFTSDLLTQETKIKPVTTNVPADKGNFSDAHPASENPYKTKVAFADAVSKVTQVRHSAETTKSPKRARTIGAVVFGVLLLVGTAVSSVYFLSNNGASQISSNANVKNENAEASAANLPIGNSNVSNANALPENNVLVAEENVSASQDNSSAAKSNVSVKNPTRISKNKTAASAPEAKSKKADDGDETFVINGEQIETKNMIIDENGIRMKFPARRLPNRRLPGSTVTPPIPPNAARTLTPDQIKKLEQLEKINPKVFVIKTPTPKPTP